MGIDYFTHRLRIGGFYMDENMEKKKKLENYSVRESRITSIHMAGLLCLLLLIGSAAVAKSDLFLDDVFARCMNRTGLAGGAFDVQSQLQLTVLMTANAHSDSMLLILSGDVLENPGPDAGGVPENDLFNLPKDLPKGMLIGHINICSILRNLDQMKLLMSSGKFDVLCISETFLNDSILNGEVNVTGYAEVLRDDRLNGDKRGGSAIYIRDSIPHVETPRLHNVTLFEYKCIEIRLNGSKPFSLVTIYRSNQCGDPIKAFYDQLESVLDVASSGNKEIIITGDFNIDLSRNYCHRHNLVQLFQQYSCTQLINESTRITENTSTLIDHIWAYDLNNVKKSGVIPVGISDHNLVYIIRKVNSGFIKDKYSCHTSVKYRCFKHFNRDRYLNDLDSADWSGVYSSDSADSAWLSFKDTFIYITDSHAPIRERRIKSQNVAWMTEEVLNAIHQKDYLHNKFLQDKSSVNRTNYCKFRNYVKNLITRAKKQFFENVIQENQLNPKGMWQTLKLLLPSSKSHVAQRFNVRGKILTCKTAIANAFNEYFSTIAKKLVEGLPNVKYNVRTKFVPDSAVFKLKLVSEEFVSKQIDLMSNSKATGLDCISVKLLKLAKPSIITPITFILNKSILTGEVPMEWKAARVVPIFKSGDRESTNNYRPVSILPIISKIIEKFVHESLYEYLSKLKVIAKCQSGFRPLHSTSTALIKIYDHLLDLINDGNLIGMVCVDLRKAFDTVNHEILLTKLKLYGITGTELKWFESYLYNRSQVVDFCGTMSSECKVNVGVPQGSILGPLLFLLFVNDFEESVKQSQVDLYADDTTLVAHGKSIVDIEGKLQSDLQLVDQWLKANRLILNVEKTVCMLVGTRQRLASTDRKLCISINGSVIQQVANAKLLGLYMDENLIWSVSLDHTRRKIASKLGVLARIRPFVSLETAKTIFNAICLPHFDYGNVVWYTAADCHILPIVRLQKRSARILTKASRFSRSITLFKALDWLTLQDRVTYFRAVLVYKSINGYAPEYMSEKFQLYKSGRNTRSCRQELLCVPRPKLEIFRASFKYTGATLWNSIPLNIRKARSVEHFKKDYLLYIKQQHS